MKSQYAMIIDSSKCIDCKACLAACKQVNDLPEDHWRNWIKYSEQDPQSAEPHLVHFQPGGCMQCNTPTCVEACPTRATYKDERDGTVKIDYGLCIGCGSCIPACPYGARYRNPITRKVDKCDFCDFWRNNFGLEPACVSTCPTKARIFGDIHDPKTRAYQVLRENSDRVVRLSNPQTETKPNMFYLKNTAPKDWPKPARTPDPIKAMLCCLTPGLQGILGASILGALVMWGKQIFTRSEEEQDDRESE